MTNQEALWPRPQKTAKIIAPPALGARAVLHQPSARGRKSKQFPQLNITATAQVLGVTKSHLAKVLQGHYRPSLTLAVRLAEILNQDLYQVVALYRIPEERKEQKKA